MVRFDFFHGNQAAQYMFYILPRLLFVSEKFKSISVNAKLLYSLLLARAALSDKNGNTFQDEKGRTYIYFKRDDVMHYLGCTKERAAQYFKELEKIGLIIRKVQGQGKPVKIYVKRFFVDTAFAMEDISEDMAFFYGDQAQQFGFYRVPAMLFTEEIFSDLSSEAKVLYALLLARAGISFNNPDAFQDDYNRTYVYFTRLEVMEQLGCTKEKAAKFFKELEKIGLIERVAQGQGKPMRIYVKQFYKDDFQMSGNADVKTSGNADVKLSGNADVQMSVNPDVKAYGNPDTKYIDRDIKRDIDRVNISSSSLVSKIKENICKISPETMTMTIERIKTRIDYDDLCRKVDIQQLDIVCDVIHSVFDCDLNDVYVVFGQKIPCVKMREKFTKLTKVHIEYVLEQVQQRLSVTGISNMSRYLTSALYNSVDILKFCKKCRKEPSYDLDEFERYALHYDPTAHAKREEVQLNE